MSRAPARIAMTPPHPGMFIREEILDELGLSVSQAAKALDVRRATLSDLIHGNAAVVGGNGIADRKGVRGEDGDAVEDAGVARRLHDATKRERNRC